MSEQPPSSNLKWFRPQPDVQGNYWFSEGVQYLAAAWCVPTLCWVYVAGAFEPDGGDEWVLQGHGGQIELSDIDWLARLDSGKPNPQKTLPGLEGGK